MGIECQIICFVHTHRFAGPHPQLFDWATRYFANSDQEPVLPVYLQHEGHSQTIIGIEHRKANNERHLLMFDPGVKSARMRQTGGNENRWLDDTVRRAVGRVAKPSYEMLLFTGNLLAGEDLERAKAKSRNGIAGQRFVSWGNFFPCDCPGKMALFLQRPWSFLLREFQWMTLFRVLFYRGQRFRICFLGG